MRYISITTGLAVGNFVYQFFVDYNWDVAAERSFFQAVAIFSVWLVERNNP